MIKTNTVQKLPKVLIIDDDLTIVEIIQSILENSEFDIMTASDGDRGLEAIKEWQPDIVLCDLVMPTIDGYEVLVRLQNDPNQSNVPVVFMSSKNDYNSVRTGMRLGADDYLIKPFTPEELLSTVKSRLIRNRNAEKKYKEFSKRIKNQLDWLLWKEKAKQTNKLNMGKVMINNFRHTISQGVGDGALVTQIEMIDMFKKPDADSYKIPVKIIDSLISTAKSVRNWLENLEKTAELAEAEYLEESISSGQIAEIVSDSIRRVEKFRSIKNQIITAATVNQFYGISGNERVISLAMRELLVNAFKYSPDNSKVKILYFINQDIFSILVINEIQEMQRGISGIPEDSENEIFEPYYRLNNIFDERFYNEELGMGIGLTVIQGAINQIGGEIAIYESVDHTDIQEAAPPRKKIIAELNFRVLKSEKVN